MINRKKSGFTLIELMVVIVIIGILATLGLVSFQNALKRSRNTKRIGDMKDFASAQEQIKALNGSYVTGTNPGCPSLVGDYTLATPPKVGDYTCYTSTTAFCASALLENEVNNCYRGTNPSGCSSATAMRTSGGTLDSFCVLGKQ